MQKRAYHHGDLRSALLDCARRIIHEEGIGKVSLREVARRLGVSHGAPAHHFKNKQALLTALAVQGYERLAETVIAELSASGTSDPRRQLEVIGRAYVRFAVENPDHFGMMFEQVRLDDVRLTWRDGRSGSRRELQLARLRLEPDGALTRIDAQFALDGERWRIEGSTGRL